MREHLETFLATVREERGKDLPRYVEEELRRYLRCGILAHGYVEIVCDRLLVADGNATAPGMRAFSFDGVELTDGAQPLSLPPSLILPL